MPEKINMSLMNAPISASMAKTIVLENIPNVPFKNRIIEIFNTSIINHTLHHIRKNFAIADITENTVVSATNNAEKMTVGITLANALDIDDAEFISTVNEVIDLFLDEGGWDSVKIQDWTVFENPDGGAIFKPCFQIMFMTATMGIEEKHNIAMTAGYGDGLTLMESRECRNSAE